MRLQTNILYRSVGTKVKNYKGEVMGKIIEVTYDKNRRDVQYVILSSNEFFGNMERYFAIPACIEMIKISNEGEIILNIDKDDLQLAKRISFENCPKPLFEFDPLIYQLTNYSVHRSDITKSVQQTNQTGG